MKISVIIPVFNELKTVGIIINKILELKDLDIQIILVDDFSTDGTRKLIQDKLSSKVDKVIFHSSNLGKGSDGAKPGANQFGDAGGGGSGGYPTNNSTSTGSPSQGYGGGSANYTTGHGASNQGGRGCVRIIWPGDTRYYPNTLTTDQ